MKKLFITNRSKDAVALLNEVLSHADVQHGSRDHRFLVGASVITAYYNAGGKIAGGTMTKGKALDELAKRCSQIPERTCETWGICGSSTAIGQALSVITGSTPLKEGAWEQCQRITSNALGRMADYGGIRCCKANSYTAVLTAIDFLNENFPVRMERPAADSLPACQFCATNPDCVMGKCPYSQAE